MIEVFYDPRPEIQGGLQTFASQVLGYPIFDSNSIAFGVRRDDQVIAAVVFHNLELNPETGRPQNLSVTLATTDKRWCTRKTLKNLYAYPFLDLKVRRLYAMCAKSNKKMRKLFEGLGFKFEGVARRAYPGEKDATVYSQLREEYLNGKIHTRPTATA